MWNRALTWSKLPPCHWNITFDNFSARQVEKKKKVWANHRALDLLFTIVYNLSIFSRISGVGHCLQLIKSLIAYVILIARILHRTVLTQHPYATHWFNPHAVLKKPWLKYSVFRWRRFRVGRTVAFDNIKLINPALLRHLRIAVVIKGEY